MQLFQKLIQIQNSKCLLWEQIETTRSKTSQESKYGQWDPSTTLTIKWWAVNMPEVGFELGPGEGTKITKRLLYLCAISPLYIVGNEETIT